MGEPELPFCLQARSIRWHNQQNIPLLVSGSQVPGCPKAEDPSFSLCVHQRSRNDKSDNARNNQSFLQQAEFSGFECSLRPVAYPQLAQDIAEVILDGAACDVEGFADLTIGSATRKQGQNLALALG